MKAHAAALALVGWYLMTPGVMRGTKTSPAYMLDPSVPLSLWTVQSVHDTAKSCNAAAKASYERGSKTLDATKTEVGRRVIKNTPDLGAVIALSEADMHAQCIASDDPRLKEK